MGVRRLSLRVRTAAGQLGFASRGEVALGLRPVGTHDDRAVLRDLTGPGTLLDGTLRLPADAEWSQVFFSLEGSSTGLVRVEVYHPDNRENVSSATPDDWFEVDHRRGASAAPAPAAPGGERELSWADGLADEGARKVFLHLEKHGAITEVEAVGFLGSQRAFRRFSLEFDGYLRKVPFKVRVEPAADGKRYVKEGEK